MSLESYRKALEEQREREKQYDNGYQHPKTPSVSISENNKQNSKGRRMSTAKFLFLFILCSIGLGAIISNPTEDEARKLIKQKAIEIIKDNANEDRGSEYSFTDFLSDMMLPIFYDSYTKTTVTNYNWFSTFTVSTVNFDENLRVKGIIIFGRIIPLSKETF